MASERAQSDTATLRRAGSLLREIAATEGQSGKAVQKVRFLNDLAKDLKTHAISLSKRLNPLAALRCLCIPIASPNAAARAGAYRALRYLMVTQELHDAVLDMRVDVLIARSMDQDASKETERLQAVKLIRSMLLLQPLNFPLTFGRVLVAVAESAQDNLAQSALAILCELTVLNPMMASISGGIRAIHMGIVANHSNVTLQRIQKAYGNTLAAPAPLTEFMTLSLLRLYNSQETRCYLRQDVELETLIAPLLDVHYKHSAESADGTSQQAMNEKTAHINASQMAVLTMFRTWQGLVYLCRPSDKSALQALIDVLPYPDESLQVAVLNVLFSVFHLKTPVETDDFGEALATICPSEFQEEWQLDQGWVAEEGRALLPRSGTRVNMMDQYHAVVLQAFLSRGLLERLVEVSLSQVPQVSTKATILIGELLHMANTLLPVEIGCSSHCLPTLVTVATDFQGSDERRNRANSVINNLDYLHQRKKDPLRANSLYLEQIMEQAKSAEGDKRKITRGSDWALQDIDDAQLAVCIRDTNVAQDKEYTTWNFQVISSILRLPNITYRRLEDQHPKFIKRLVTFFRPNCNEFCVIPATQENIRKYSVVGLQLVSSMMAAYVPPEEPPKSLAELLSEIVQNITLVTKRSDLSRSVFSSTSLAHTLSRDYFLFAGKLSSTSAGCSLLEKCNAFREFLEVPELEEREDLQRLLVSSLDYSRDGPSRIVLSKLLTNTTKDMRLYATSHLRVLHRARVPFFQTWCMEMLVTQLYDPCVEVAEEALDVLDEACEDESCLHTLVTLQPSLLHLGQRGRSLFMRFAGIGTGLRFLKNQERLESELDRWFQTENAAYVMQVELRTSQAFTGFKLQPEGQYTRRSATDRPLAESRELWVPVHFYGQLVQQREGFDMLVNKGHIEVLVERLATTPTSPEQLLEVKAAIWALCHIGTKLWGLKVLLDNGVLNRIVDLLESTTICTLKGSCILALSLVASTRHGCDALMNYGYQSVRHSSDALWPVTTPASAEAQHQLGSRMHSDTIDAGSTSESGDELSPEGGNLLGASRLIKRSLSTAETRISSSMSIALSTTSIDDLEAFSPEDADGPILAGSGGVQSLRSFKSSATIMGVSTQSEHLQFSRSSTQPSSMSGGNMRARRKASHPMGRKGSIQMVGDAGSGFVGICLPTDIDRLFQLTDANFTGSLAESLNDPVGLRFDSFHDIKDCLVCLHRPVASAEHFTTAQIDLEEATERGLQENSSFKPKDAAMEEEQPDITTFEGQLKVRRSLLSFIARLSGAVGSRNNQTQILSYKEKYPSIFRDVCLYSQVASLLEFYHFRVHVRRFIQHLFDETDFAAIFRGSGRPSLPELLMIAS